MAVQGQYTYEQFKDMIKLYENSMDDYLYVCDFRNDIYYISEKVLKRFALPANEFHHIVDMHRKFVFSEDLDILLTDLEAITAGKKDIHDIPYRWYGKDGQPIWINCRGDVLRDEDGQPLFLLGCVNEIGAKQIADNVSGLLGDTALRNLFLQHDDIFPAGYMLRVGIDDFRAINEKMGIEYGDYVLNAVGKCIRKAAVKKQWVYRMAADEFIVFDSKGGTGEEARGVFSRIQAGVEEFLASNNYEAIFTVSGGVISSDDIKEHIYSNYMKFSQFALAEAKLRGRNQLYIFKAADYEKFLRKRRILRAMRESVAEDCKGFSLNFQPIISASDETLFAAETLLRYQMPEGERLSPVEFVPILEESGLIIPVGKWVIKNALSMCAECQKSYPDFRISINLSYIQVLKSSVADEIMGNIRATSLAPSSVIMEMTESGYLESSEIVHNLWGCLKNIGVNIAIDDFGTGYSNFQSIGEMVPQIVKVDRGFTMKALSRKYENQLMKNIINMVHSLGLKVCIEGIETEEELSKIRELEPDFIQGYYYSRPVEQELFIEKFIA